MVDGFASGARASVEAGGAAGAHRNSYRLARELSGAATHVGGFGEFLQKSMLRTFEPDAAPDARVALGDSLISLSIIITRTVLGPPNFPWQDYHHLLIALPPPTVCSRRTLASGHSSTRRSALPPQAPHARPFGLA